MIGTDTCFGQATGHCSSAPGLTYAIAVSRCEEVNDSLDCPEIVQVSENMEVAEPYLNPCSGLVPRERWSANVLWAFALDEDGGLDGVAEIGWRKICTSSGPKKVFFFAVSRVGIVNDGDYVSGFTPQVGATYEFTLKAANDGSGKWTGLITGPGLGDGIQHEKVLSGFDHAMFVEAGGENYHLMNDMGVVGHKDVRFKLSSGVQKTLISEPFKLRMEAPRYDIVAAHNYFQTRSDIHIGATPTPVASTDECAPGW